jgi:hypothetical protein
MLRRERITILKKILHRYYMCVTFQSIICLIFGFSYQRYMFGIEDRIPCYFGRIRIIFQPKNNIFNFQIIQFDEISVFFTSQSNSLLFIDYSIGGYQKKCYLTFTIVRNTFISFLEIIAFQRITMNIFTVQIIRKLHEELSLSKLKNLPSSSICCVDEKNIHFWF